MSQQVAHHVRASLGEALAQLRRARRLIIEDGATDPSLPRLNALEWALTSQLRALSASGDSPAASP